MHPYVELENHKAWKIIKRALKDLERNKDIILNTAPEYVIGYLVQTLENEKLIDNEEV